jgi:hypothetical protein
MNNPRRQRWFTIGLVAALSAWILGQIAWKIRMAWPFSTDDAYIPLRYAAHWAGGHGILWNIGQAPVEGYSSFTYLVIATAAIKLGIEPIIALKVVGVASLVGACVLMWAIASIWVGPILACLPALLFSSQYGAIWWAVSGLETSFYVFLSLAATWLFLRGWGDLSSVSARDDSEPRISFLLLGAGLVATIVGMTRPDGPIVGLGLGFIGILNLWIASRSEKPRSEAFRRLTRIGLRKIMVFGLAFAVPFAAYFVWRLSYYGRLFPNTVYCKHHPGFTDMTLLKDYARLAWPVVICSLPLVLRKYFDGRFVFFWLLPVAYASLLINASKIIGHYHRHVLMAYSLLLITAAAGIGVLIRAAHRRLPLGHPLAEGIVVLAVAIFLFAQSSNAPDRLRREADIYHNRMEVRSSVAHWLNQRLDSDDLVATPDTGIIAYLLRARVLDIMCLNCVEATRPPISLNLSKYALHTLMSKPRYIVTVANARHGIMSAWVMAILSRKKVFHQLYREIAFFPTWAKKFNIAVYQLRKEYVGRRLVPLLQPKPSR